MSGDDPKPELAITAREVAGGRKGSESDGFGGDDAGACRDGCHVARVVVGHDAGDTGSTPRASALRDG